MSKPFQIGETVPLDYEARKAGVLYDPVTSVKVETFKPDGSADVASTDMTKTGTGLYTYLYQSAGKGAGIYRVRVTATDGAYITITDGVFTLD